MQEIINAETLTVVYKGGVKALNGLDLSVNKGELFCVVGPNGAGKTTSIKVFTTLLKPTSGKATVAGYDVVKDAAKVRKVIGYVPQGLSADDELTGLENVILQCRLYGITGTKAQRIAREVLAKVNLDEAKNRRVSSYSGGMRRRLEVAMALVNTPEILFLDEPTLGLDVQSRLIVWEYMTQLRKEEGVTVVFTTHYMEEADRLSDRVAIIDRGRVVASGPPSELKSRVGGDIIIMKVEGEGVESSLSSLSVVKKVDRVNDEYRVKVTSGERDLPLILNELSSNGLAVKRIELVKPSLDQVFVELTGRVYREEEEGVDFKLQHYIREVKR